ncbi:cytochrome P450 [Phenylobacterium sp. LjRoot225]|uniref:cytochrome P450 n=1 Tax=Phenylobacterium sp. LjRoot225 TaxID=3342285 RepID=UPI003ECE067E
MSQPRFRPAAPFRPTTPPRLWRRLSGELATNWVAGWPRAAFRERYMFARVITVRNHIINDPDAVGHVLLDNAANYEKPALIKRILAPAVGWNLLVADGDIWREQRRLMAPVFTPAAVESFTQIFRDVALEQTDRWARETPNRIDVAEAATHATFEVMSRSLFSGDAVLTSEAASGHITATLASAGKYSVVRLLGLPWLDQSRIRRDGLAGSAFLRAKLTEFIRRRQANPAPPKDFMTRLLDAFAETHPPEEAAELALGNGILFFVAGHETTANALTWALYLMGGDPEVQERAAAEAIAAIEAGGSPMQVAGRLPYLRQVLDETMRLYPPATRMDRSPITDDVLCGRPVLKGDMVTIWPWLLHRHEALWDEPDLFDPENFSAEAKAKHHRFQYIPFGAGPRICIGQAFAINEALLILAEWLSRYRFRLDPTHEVAPTAAVTLRPKGGMPMFLERRAQAGQRAA